MASTVLEHTADISIRRVHSIADFNFCNCCGNTNIKIYNFLSHPIPRLGIYFRLVEFLYFMDKSFNTLKITHCPLLCIYLIAFINVFFYSMKNHVACSAKKKKIYK